MINENNVDYIVMWSAQTKQVIDTLEQDHIYYVKKKYITEKYGQTAWVFQEAYRFFAEKSKGMVEKPEEAESPVWMFYDKKWSLPGQETFQLELRIPRDEVILFDLRLWSKILNLSYVADKTQENDFEKKLRSMGMKDSVNVFRDPYYPQLKREIIKSWDTLFTAGVPDVQYMQGAAWMIKKEWILSICG